MALGQQPRWTVRPAAGAQVDIDVGLRDYMLRIYNYMASGLALTGIVAYVAAAGGADSFIAHIYRTPLMWLVMLSPLGFVMVLSYGINRMQASTAQALFWLFAGAMGLSISTIFLVYTGASIARVFFITAGTFAGDEPLRLHDAPRSLRHGRIHVHGADRHHHRLAGEHVYRFDGGCNLPSRSSASWYSSG